MVLKNYKRSIVEGFFPTSGRNPTTNRESPPRVSQEEHTHGMETLLRPQGSCTLEKNPYVGPGKLSAGDMKVINQIKTVLLLGALSAVLVAVGGALSPGSMWFFLGIALLMNLGAYFYSDKMVLAMHRARPLSPQQAPGLHQMVEELARNADIPKPRIYLIPQAQPNAFATGRNPENGVVAVTEGIMRLLSERELRGVLAHEIAHIKNRDILIASIAAAFATAVTFIANILQWTAIFGGGRDDEDGSPLGAFAMALLAPIAASLIQLAISRSREFIADETGARISRDPRSLANALEKLHLGAQRVPLDAQPATASLFIVSPLSGRAGVQKLFSTHPAMEERISRLRSMYIAA